MDILLLPFQYEFFRHGAMAAVLVGGLCGLIGVYIVLRGMSYIGHGLAHAVFGGAVVAFVMEINFYVGAGLWGFLAALLINQTTRRTRINADAAIGVVTTASFAIGVALISRYRRFTQSFDAALFGNILGVSRQDVWVIVAVTAAVTLLVLLLYKQLLFTTFDAEVAQVYGVPVGWVDSWFALLLAATIIASIQILGVTMIAAALVIPAITARLLTDSFHRMMFISVTLGAFTGLLGIYISFYVDVSSGATIVLVQAACFILALLLLARRRAVRLSQTHL
ncbi:MAG: metal ABC transporter permease [Chloroflexi bacterium]|nr:metal ABC transporter permease [Chloroflexota bacterium]